MTAKLLLDPRLDGLEIGTREWFERQGEIIASRPLIRTTYDRWYSAMLRDVETVPASSAAHVLEIGSGSGYVKRVDPKIITSDIVEGNADMVVDAGGLPFPDGGLRAILLTHVFHHIPDVRRFLAEARRTLVEGGVIAIIDVSDTPLAKLVLGRFHPEAYDQAAKDWALDVDAPCGGANQALAWIVLKRDRHIFEREFPQLKIEIVELLPWLGYLLSGGVTRRNLVPGPVAQLISALDSRIAVTNRFCALHWHIRIRKTTT